MRLQKTEYLFQCDEKNDHIPSLLVTMSFME